MSLKVLERKLAFYLPAQNVSGVALFNGNQLVIQSAGKTTNPQPIKNINDLYEIERVFKSCFNKDVLNKGWFIKAADCTFEGNINNKLYRCTIQAVIPQGQAVAIDKTVNCMVSAIDGVGNPICNNVVIAKPYHHMNASLNEAEKVIKRCLGGR